MAEKKTVVSTTTTRNYTGLFEKQNIVLMVAGAVVMAIGMLLMAGGKSSDPSVFNEKEVYSTTRITIAPLLIIAGLVIEIIAIFRKPKEIK